MSVGLGIGRGSPMRSVDADWLLRDEFIGELAAGSVNGTAAEPGPGTRTVVDAETKISISSGRLTFAAKSVGAHGNQSLVLDACSRVAGRVLVASITTGSGLSEIPIWCNDTTPSGAGNSNFAIGMYIYPNGVAIKSNLHASVIVTDQIPGSTYLVSHALRSVGAMTFLKVGEWRLLWIEHTGSSSPLYPGYHVYSGAAVSNFLRVPVDLWLPTPLASDGFGSAFGTTDGLGHAEGIAGGIGAGGSGLTWSNVGGTWSVSGGKAINTPSVGAELLTNGNMELDSNWTNRGSPVTNERSVEQVHGGTYSRKLVSNSADDALGQNYTVLAGSFWYRIQAYVYLESGPQIAIHDYNTGSWINSTATVGAWVLLKATVRLGSSDSSFFSFRSFLNSPVTAYMDDASFVPLTLASLFSLSNLSCSDVFAGVALTQSNINVQAGLALNWNSPTAPTSGIIVYLTGSTIVVDKCVAGTWSNVSVTVYTYSAGARLVVAKSGTEYRVYYNQSFIVAVTISDASIVSNTLHGLFSTDAGNTLDDYTCYATGTNGEYAELDKWS